MSRARDLSKLGNPNVIKADTNSVGFGTQVAGNPANADSSLISAGIVTAAVFYGDGSNLEGVASAGLGTAVDDTKDSIGQNIYFTNQELSINENTTVNAPDTSSIAYTQYQQVTVESGSELIIADGDSFIPDVLGIGTALQASTAGAGNGLFGTVYADNIENVAGRGGPHFPLGITVAGVSTLSGNVSIGGTLTYEDVTNVDSIGIVTARDGIDSPTNLVLRTGGNERLRIDSSGRLMVATTSTGGISGAADDIIIGSIGDSTVRGITFATADSASIRWADSGDNAMGRIQYSNSTDIMSLHTMNGERLRIGSDGQIGLSGANYGTSGQVITSQGAGAAPQWATPAGGAWTVLAHHDFATTNASTNENRGWTSDYMQVKCVFSYLSCGNATAQGLKCGFYMDTSLGQQGTLDATSNAYRRTGFPLRFTANSNNLWYNGTDITWVFGNGDTSLYWSGELIFPIATAVGAGNNVDKYAWGIVNRDVESDRVACEHGASYNKLIVGAKLENTYGNSWTEGRVTWYGLKKS